MPVTEIPLDSSTQEENVTLLHGRNILIKLIEDQRTQQFLVDPNVRTFINTEDMTHEKFREIIQKLVAVDEEIEHILQGKYDFGLSLSYQNFMKSATAFAVRDVSSLHDLAMHKERKGKIKKNSESIKKLEKEAENLRKKANETLVQELSEKDYLIIESEKELKSFNPNLNLLTTSIISRCPNCGGFMSEQESKPPHEKTADSRTDIVRSLSLFESYIAETWAKKPRRLIEVREKTKCPICGTTVTPRNAKNLTLHRLQQLIKKVWESNVWFEHYLSAILNSFGWKTWPHVHVLGSSGIRHEVDILGVKGGYVLVCECKTGNVSRQDVFNFWTKTYDIKSHLSILALIQELPEPETKQFIMKNPSVTLLENLGQKKKEQIISELKGSVIQRI